MPAVVVVGAGMSGTACAWRCAQRGPSVALVDPDPSGGAWRAAAGMLAPVIDVHYTESALLCLNLDSAARYPGYVAELTDATGLPTGYLERGTIDVAWDGADLRHPSAAAGADGRGDGRRRPRGTRRPPGRSDPAVPACPGVLPDGGHGGVLNERRASEASGPAGGCIAQPRKLTRATRA
jgi:glycine/D-amino acid oxidase-like deaminating enzyme